MIKILLPTDGSPSADRAIEYALQRQAQSKEPYHFHLLNVQIPIASGNIQSYIRSEQLQEYYQTEAQTILAAPQAKLSAAGSPLNVHIGVGNPAEIITQYGIKLGCSEIILGSRGLGHLAEFLLGSVASRVVYLADVPVVLIK